MTLPGVLDIADHLENAAREALETMCFYGVLGRSAEDGITDDIQMVSLRFHGDATGTMVLRISSPALTELSANFFGEDLLAIEPGQTEAVACELANMICGAALSACQPEGHFDLSQPEPLVLGVPAFDREPDIHLPLDLENGKLVVCVWVE